MTREGAMEDKCCLYRDLKKMRVGSTWHSVKEDEGRKGERVRGQAVRRGCYGWIGSRLSLGSLSAGLEKGSAQVGLP